MSSKGFAFSCIFWTGYLVLLCRSKMRLKVLLDLILFWSNRISFTNCTRQINPFSDESIKSAEKSATCEVVLARLFMTLGKKSFKNIVGKGENAAFSPFPTMFSTLSERRITLFELHWNYFLQN